VSEEKKYVTPIPYVFEFNYDELISIGKSVNDYVEISPSIIWENPFSYHGYYALKDLEVCVKINDEDFIFPIMRSESFFISNHKTIHSIRPMVKSPFNVF